MSLFDYQVGIVIRQYGEPTYRASFPGVPLGFTVARNFAAQSRRRAEGYGRDLRTFMSHEFGDEFQLEATIESPVWVATQAWYEHKVHCDPENTHKLAKDMLFRAPVDGAVLHDNSDKYTGGTYDLPRYDAENPRLELWIWNL